MDSYILQFLAPLVGALFGGVASYVAIRADLAELKARMSLAETSLNTSHNRIDSILARRRNGDST